MLVSQRLRGDQLRWVEEMGSRLSPSGFCVDRAGSMPETVARIERGGVAAAVLVDDAQSIDALTLLRIIRSVDQSIPCWLVAEQLSRALLQTAWTLNAASVLKYPVDAIDVALTVLKGLNKG